MKSAPPKNVLYFGAFLGGTIGSYLPSLWGADMFSLTSMLGGVVGGVAGIVLTYQLLGN